MNNKFNKNYLFNHLPIPTNIEKNIKDINNTSILIIDSRQRDKIKYPEPNDYVFELENPYKNIYEIELLNAYVSDSGYFINKYNNSLQLNLDGNIIDINIPIGDYFQNDNDDYINLDEHITNTFKSLNFDISCKYNYNLQKFIFFNGNDPDSTSSTFKNISLNFSDGEIKREVETSVGDKVMESYNPKKYNYINNSIGNILGFSANNFSNENVLTVKYEIKNNKNIHLYFKNKIDYDFILSLGTLKEHYFKKFYLDSMIIDLGTFSNSAFIKSTNINNLSIEIEERNNTKTNTDLTEGKIHTNFIISDKVANFQKNNFLLLEINDFDRFDSISKNIQNSFAIIPLSDSIKYFDNTKNYGNLKIFKPILARLNKIHVKFRTFDGNLYDFNGKEHSIVLAISYKTNLT